MSRLFNNACDSLLILQGKFSKVPSELIDNSSQDVKNNGGNIK